MSQPPQQPAPPPRRSNGCLWGCLGVVLLAVLIGGGGLLWSGWYLYQGYKNDPVLQSALAVVRTDRVAHDALGDDIKIETIESENFTAQLGKARSSTYTVMLRGSKGEGKLHVTMHFEDGGMKIVSMVLTGPDGTRYNLTDNTLTPSSKSI